MLAGPVAVSRAQASRGSHSHPCSRGTRWTPHPGTLQGGLLWAEQGMGQVERAGLRCLL